MPNYSAYDGSAESSNDNDDSDYDDVEVRLSTYTTVEGEMDKVFGTGSGGNGQSLGINWSDVQLTDGALYWQHDGEYFKTFSWEEVAGMTPEEAAERDMDPSADDADEIVTKTYFGDTYTYELVAARVPESENVDADSKARELLDTEGEHPEFSEWEDLGGDPYTFERDLTMWYSGNQEYGASNSAKVLAETLTNYGNDAVLGEGDNLHEWLIDDSGTDIMRDDLAGRRVEFFIVRREGEDYTYNLPIIEDMDTGKRIRAPGYGESDTDADEQENPGDGDESDALLEAKARDASSYPEPLAEFVRSADGLDLTEERANSLLDDMIATDDTGLDEEMVADHGGRDEIIAQVI